MNTLFLFLSPITAAFLLLYGAVVAPTASAEQAVALGAAFAVSVSWRVFLARRDARRLYGTVERHAAARRMLQ